MQHPHMALVPARDHAAPGQAGLAGRAAPLKHDEEEWQ
jgi:hypothetical protein